MTGKETETVPRMKSVAPTIKLIHRIIDRETLAMKTLEPFVEFLRLLLKFLIIEHLDQCKVIVLLKFVKTWGQNIDICFFIVNSGGYAWENAASPFRIA